MWTLQTIPLEELDFVFLCSLRLFKPSIVVDIGAFDGAESLRMREFLPSAEIIAFEANPENYEEFKSNPFERQGIHYLHAAISSEVGEVKIYVPKWASKQHTENRVYRGIGSTLKRATDQDDAANVIYSVPSITLDSYFAANRTGSDEEPTFALWIDVEGAAFDVLRGGDR